jgi:hypothetical protein
LSLLLTSNTYATKSNYLQDNGKKNDYYSNIASWGKQVYDGVKDHSSLIKRRKMVKGEINKEEYQELRKAIGS